MAGALEVAQSNSNPRIKMKYTSVLKFLYIWEVLLYFLPTHSSRWF
jgi:hypothetical protein